MVSLLCKLTVAAWLGLNATPIHATDWENVRLIQLAQASSNYVVEDEATVFQAGQPCQNLADIRISDIRNLANAKFKWLRDVFCQLDEIESCKDYESYLPEGFRLKPASQGTMCKLLIKGE